MIVMLMVMKMMTRYGDSWVWICNRITHTDTSHTINHQSICITELPHNALHKMQEILMAPVPMFLLYSHKLTRSK